MRNTEFFHRYIILLVILLTIGCVKHQVVKIEPEISQLNTGDKFAYIIYDNTNQKILLEQNSDQFLVPASLFKLITNFAALEILGPEKVFPTNIYKQGNIRNGILYGDLILVGSGDPTFFIENLYNLAFQIKSYGINQIKGKIKYYDRNFFQDDEINILQPTYASYNPGFSGLNLNFNTLKILREGNEIYKVPAIDKIVINPSFNKRLTPKYSKNSWKINKNTKKLLLPIKDSSYYFASVLIKILNNINVKVEKISEINKLPLNVELVAHYNSKPVKEIVKQGLVHSNNLYSEILLIHIAKELKCKFSNLSTASNCLKDWYLTNYPTLGFDEFMVVNGSGLSDEILIKPDSLLKLLQIANKKQYGNDFFPTYLPMSGVSGTLKTKYIDSSNRLFAKTGTMSFINSLAGYYYSQNREIIFVFITNNLSNRKNLLKGFLTGRDSEQWKKIVDQSYSDFIESFETLQFDKIISKNYHSNK